MMMVYNLKVCDSWFNGLSAKAKAKIMEDRMTRMELKRLSYMPVTPDKWWAGKNPSQKADIYARFIWKYPKPILKPTLPPKKNKSRSKTKIKKE